MDPRLATAKGTATAFSAMLALGVVLGPPANATPAWPTCQCSIMRASRANSDRIDVAQPPLDRFSESPLLMAALCV